MRPITTRIPDDTHRRLKEESDKKDASMSEIACERIEKSIEYAELKRECDLGSVSLPPTGA